MRLFYRNERALKLWNFTTLGAGDFYNDHLQILSYLLAEEEVAPPALDVIIGADERVSRVMHFPVYRLLPPV
jgi:hypothetical protein